LVEIELWRQKAADLAGEGFGGLPWGHWFFPPRFALRVYLILAGPAVVARLFTRAAPLLLSNVALTAPLTVTARIESAEAPQFCLMLWSQASPQQTRRVKVERMTPGFVRRYGHSAPGLTATPLGVIRASHFSFESSPRGMLTIEEQPRTDLARRGEVGTVNNPTGLVRH
jgi:hypothetical protein